jgi:hypothetical protein
MAALPAAIPYDAFLDGTTAHSTFSLAPLWSFHDKLSLAPGDVGIAVLLGAIAAGILFALLPRRFALVAPALVLIYFALVTSPLEGITTRAARDAQAAGIQVREGGPSGPIDRTWVDDVVGRDADVTWLWPVGSQHPVWETEFFNDSVGRVYNLYGPIDGLPQETLAIDEDGFLRNSRGEAVESEYVLTPASLSADGEVVAADTGIGSKLVRTAGPLRMLEEVDGVYVDHWSGPVVSYTRYGCTGGAVTVTLSGYADLHPNPQTIVASVGDREVARTTLPVGAVEQPFTVPLQAGDDGRCVVVFNVSPTAVPAEVLQSTDTRELGALFLGFEFESPGR